MKKKQPPPKKHFFTSLFIISCSLGPGPTFLYASDKPTQETFTTSPSLLRCIPEEFLTEEEIENLPPLGAFNPSFCSDATRIPKTSAPIFKDPFWQVSSVPTLPPSLKIQVVPPHTTLRRNSLSLENVSLYEYCSQNKVLHVFLSPYQKNSSTPFPPMLYKNFPSIEVSSFKEKRKETPSAILKLPSWSLDSQTLSPSSAFQKK